MVLFDCYSWAKQTFGLAQLGDPRRTRRLVTLATSLARHTGLSVVKSSHSTAEVEGAYRLMRNHAVSPEAIADAGFSATGSQYTGHRFQNLLTGYGLRSSMGDVGTCWDNAVMERFWGSLKHE